MATKPKKISQINLSNNTYNIDVANELKATQILGEEATSKVVTVQAAQKPDGKNNLFDENNKISSHYISDIILGQLKFGGTLQSYDSSKGYTVTPSQLILSKLYELTNYQKDAASIDSLILSHVEVDNSSFVSISMLSKGEVEKDYVDTKSTAFEGFYFISAVNLPDEYLVGDWLVINNKNFEKIDNTDTITHIEDTLIEGYVENNCTSLLSIVGSGLKLDKIAKNAKGEAVVATPEGNDPKAIVNVEYLEANKVSELRDIDIKLDTDLKTYYNVGKITNASGTNPQVIGHAGESLRAVFNNLFNMDEVQPSITQQPSVSCSLSSSASDERGTTISSVSYSISFNDGAYTNESSTGVSMTGYSFSKGTASSTTATSGTLTLPSAYTVGSSSAFSTTLTATHSQGNVAKTNLGNNSNPTVRIASGSKTASPSFSKTAVDYPYFASSSSTSASTAAGSKTKAATSLIGDAGASCTYGANAYVWIFVRKGNATSQATKTIETYSEIAKAWGTLLGGTDSMGEVTFTKANGVSDTFYAYKTKNAAQGGDTFKLRLK